jgi:hypothetical protein
VPTDLYFDPTDEKSCQKCGKVIQVKDYICLGIKAKTVRVEKTYLNNIWGRIHKKVYEFFLPPKDIDLMKIYPFL